jgi:hypothetical protein
MRGKAPECVVLSELAVTTKCVGDAGGGLIPTLVSQGTTFGATDVIRSFVVRYIETLERPSQHHASSGTQTMSLQ